MSSRGECNADLGHPCDAGGTEDDPEPCAKCAAWLAETMRAARADWDRSTERERHPQRYAQDMHECGHGYLLTADEREMVDR